MTVLADRQRIEEDRGGSADSLFAGLLICRQPERGYRFSVDSVLLAHFSRIQAGDAVLDLGCGCGIVGLLLMFRWGQVLERLVGLELQPELAGLAKENARLNGYAMKFTIIEGDLRDMHSSCRAESFSRVYCNPPFYVAGTGRASADRQSHIARHQICSTTAQTMAAASFAVKNRGTVNVVFPAEGLSELFQAMRAANLEPKRLQPVYSYPGQSMEASLVLVEAVKNGGAGLALLPPFFIYSEKNGPYSDAMEQMYAAQWKAGREGNETGSGNENT